MDGDTFDVSGVRVRLHGIDAPETDQTCITNGGRVWACGAWVTEQVRAAYSGKVAQCVEIDQDRYGRVVARCEIGGQDVGETLVQRGLALAYRKYSMAYDTDERQAALFDVGLHAGIMARPSEHRAARTKGRFAPDQDCAIKGNISKSGKIYHLPGQVHYPKTGISLHKGERWFCTESEALAAGWRAARR